MKKNLLLVLVFVGFSFAGFAQQYKVITTVESIVPMGLGRSRIIDERQQMDYKIATTVRKGKQEGEEKEEKQEKVDRSDLKIDNFEETKLLNFYSGVGINFQNIASNDALISS